ncbi:MAG: VCBS repeat-containing protein [Adhaeribacter sp.]
MFRNFYLLIIPALLLLAGCNTSNKKEEKAAASEPLFSLLSATATGVSFANIITENDTLNPLEFEYIYNGGGVAVGDINNDGLADIFFSGNQVPSKLYLNKGNFKFQDITVAAGINTNGRWASGAAMTDINNDGLLDIYVCVTGKNPAAKRHNLLYLNQGNNTFTDAAAQYGLADDGYTTHAAFLDYDKDGDLDLYLLNHTLTDTNPNLLRPRISNGTAPNTDKLYRNNGNNTFTDVSKQAGITIEGNGLGVAVSDINQDGWLDIYVANDYLAGDLLYLNNQNGTFTDVAAKYFKHTSQSAMGTDVADFNNDGLVDIITLDMLPEDNERQKLMYGGSNYDRFMAEIKNGYLPQYMRNTLQLNNGNGSFSEIGQLAGVAGTDWSWSALFADFDNDGLKDLHITNGFPKDITNRDFIMYRMQGLNSSVPLPVLNKQLRKTIDELPGAKKANYLYKNNGNLTFTNKTPDWGLNIPSYSNGAAYADFDNDGDLDIVTNNINDAAFIYQNNARQQIKNNFLRINLKGNSANPNGLGSKITLTQPNQQQYYEHTPYRGFMSSVDPIIHFGLGKDEVIKQLEITWPNGKYQRLENVKANQLLTLRQEDATETAPPAIKPETPVFTDVTAKLGINYRHQEEPFIDFKIQPLVPHKYSQLGPGLAVGDVNNDNLDDFYVGGAFKHAGFIFNQQKNGSFKGTPITTQTKFEEDLGTLFFDADNDKDLDLYVVSGSSEYAKGSPYLQDKLYRNDGRGNFTLDAQALPNTTSSGSCVIAADYDQDGDLDLFVGGRLYPSQYPAAAQSYILKNESGKFRDATAEVYAPLKNIGLVTAALWTDFDQDGAVDLILTGEWMPITFLKNQGGRLVNITTEVGLPNTTGWWNSLSAGDFDNDGDVDYVAGNLGLNTKLKASEKEPVTVYARDFDGNRSIDPILAHYNQGKNVPVRSRDDLIDQLVGMRKRFPNYGSYAKASMNEVILPEEMQGVTVLQSVNMQTSYIQNLGGGKFSIKPLPVQAQFAPVFGIGVQDYNQDGHLDLLLTGNSLHTEVLMGAYDASIGLYLQGNGKGDFVPVPVTQSGFNVNGDAKGLAQLLLNGKPIILTAANDGPLKAFTPTNYQPAAHNILLAPLDAWAEIFYQDGRKARQEFYYGSTYLSQSARRVALPAEVAYVVIKDYAGKTRRIDF